MGSFRVARRGPAWNDAYARALLDPEGLLARRDTRTFKHRDAGRTVGLVILDDTALVLKLYEETGVVDRVERLLLGSPAARAADGIGRMSAAGFEVPELVAVLETTPRAAVLGSALVTRPVGGGERADHAFERLTALERRRFASALGEYLRSVHERGVYPQDLWMTNLVAVPRARGWTWVLVDLDRVRVYRRLAWKRRLKNLVQIERSLGRGADAEERACFLASYLGPVSRDELRRVGDEIVAASRLKDAEHGGAGD